MWSEILFITCSLSALVFLFFGNENRFFSVKLFLSLALVSGIVCFLPGVHSIHLPEWAMIIGITSLLIALSAIIHYLKPIHTRFPVSFSFTPAVIVIFYPLISNAYILKELLNQLMQGGALLIAFMIYLTLSNKLQNHISLLAGILLLLLTWLLYWFSGDFRMDYPWIWHLTFSAGLVAVTLSTRQIFPMLQPDVQTN